MRLNNGTGGGTEVKGEAASNYFSGVYRFAAYRNGRFEVGPALGLGHLDLDATIGGTGTVSGPGGAQGRAFSRTASQGQGGQALLVFAF